MSGELGRSGAAAPEGLNEEVSKRAAGAPAVVIVGNGMVSHRLCERLVQQGGAACPRITVLGEENRPAYDRVRLGEMLTGRRASSLTLATPDWYHKNGIELVLDDPVVTVDRERREARTRAGRGFAYDNLVFATGASPMVPKIDIADQADVFVIRTTRDLERLRDRTAKARSVAVIGGGLLGLETAKSLRDAGLAVTVIEASAQLMARQIDDEAAAVLKRKLEDAGMNVIVGEAVQRITARGAQRQVLFAPASARAPLDVDLVVISAGVQPRDELATACGIERGERGGIAVDAHLRTSDPNVFAVGDCAAIGNVTYGTVAPGYRMAEALAGTLLGHPTEFQIPTAPVTLKVAGIKVVTMGQTLRLPTCQTFRYRQDSGVYRRVVVENGRVVGATAVGEWKELGAVQDAIIGRRHLSLGWRKLFSREGKLWSSVPEATPRAREDRVCACANVTAGAIMDAVAAGCLTVDAVSQATGAARGCGSCLPLVALMVGQPARVHAAPRRWLAGLGLAALVGTVMALGASPGPLMAALERRGLERLFSDPFWQQVSGFTLLGTCVLAMLLPLAKRALRVSGGVLPVWRAVHAGIGLGAVAAVVAHTSLRTGQNMNLVLQGAFALLLLMGAAAGVFGLRQSGTVGRALRLAHLVVFWPLLGLIGLHVLAVYYF